MNKLIKSELFLLKKSGNYLAYILLVAVIPFLVAFIAVEDFFSADFYFGFGQMNAALTVLLMASTAMLAVTISRKYDNRVANYAVMDGNKPSKIILGNLFTYLPVALILFVLPSLIMLLILFKNGTGDTDNPLIMIALLLIVFTRVYTSTILVSTIFKSVIASGFFAYMRSSIEGLVGTLLIGLVSTKSPENSELILKLGDLVAPLQLESILTKNNDTTFIVTVIVSFIIDIALCYIVALFTYKKKMFK